MRALMNLLGIALVVIGIVVVVFIATNANNREDFQEREVNIENIEVPQTQAPDVDVPDVNVTPPPVERNVETNVDVIPERTEETANPVEEVTTGPQNEQ